MNRSTRATPSTARARPATTSEAQWTPSQTRLTATRTARVQTPMATAHHTHAPARVEAPRPAAACTSWRRWPAGDRSGTSGRGRGTSRSPTGRSRPTSSFRAASASGRATSDDEDRDRQARAAPPRGGRRHAARRRPRRGWNRGRRPDGRSRSTPAVLESTIHLVIGSSQTSQPADRADGERGDDQIAAHGRIQPCAACTRRDGHRRVEVQVSRRSQGYAPALGARGRCASNATTSTQQVVDRPVLEAASELAAVGLVERRFERDPEPAVALVADRTGEVGSAPRAGR